MNYLQQGDVLLFKTNDVVFPNDAVETNMLHKGDVHSHATTSPILVKDDLVYVKSPTLIKHEEHRPVLLSEGVYRKQIVVECDPMTQITRPVID
jgi:hypothetical protein